MSRKATNKDFLGFLGSALGRAAQSGHRGHDITQTAIGDVIRATHEAIEDSEPETQRDPDAIDTEGEAQ